MANWINIKNNSKVKISSIPILTTDELREDIIRLNKRPVAFFGQKLKENNSTKLFVLLYDDEKSELLLSSSVFETNADSYKSITSKLPSFHIFEREFFEEFNIEPKGHPWLKPVRKNQDSYKFFEMEGDEVHQVAVGPIHAGVIEPGHFRFMCNGETVYHLEIMLGYQNKNVEELFVKSPSNQLAESVSGDSVIAYNMAYSQLMESLKDIKISKRAELIRKILLEMERIAVHIGDLGAISGDIGYLMGASVFGATRTLVINTTLKFSGSRFGRGMISTGGVNYDIQNQKIDDALLTLDKVSKDTERMVSVMLKNSTVMSRLEKTGTLSYEKAKELGLVGMAARASGVKIDSRFDYDDELLDELQIKRKPFSGTGDVNSRFKLRYKEIKESISIVRKMFSKLKQTEDRLILESDFKENAPDSFAVSIVEGWRGEVVHIAITDSLGKIERYKIKDPSFNNWYGLALAVRNNGISDFPLCNKSFNLSYSGCDL